MPDLPMFATVEELETEHMIRDAADRIQRWGLAPTGSYQPPAGKPVPIYSLAAVLENAHA